ncbi:Low conductance mechanosensitive channel YnaI [Pontiella desulfatans]|uniref:Low conductance mechanosensitive channel YnaI n=1 Tax=Pontiella desulfatans TaxID=2750659 RepID=A0A6C2UBA8_PONDE|nr:mechanosensitive ion channel family protein [Pontiella desulfatans]VGO16644.1 Low conductance mechanosensitive channel YnaI [Pontiella desulfatans]
MAAGMSSQTPGSCTEKRNKRAVAMNMETRGMQFKMILSMGVLLILAGPVAHRTVGAPFKPASTPGVLLTDEDLTQHPLKPPDTSSPRATLTSFMSNMNRSYHLLMEAHEENMAAPGWIPPQSARERARLAQVKLERAAACLNLSKIPLSLRQKASYENALRLKEIMDRVELPPLEDVPDAAAIEMEQAPAYHWRLPNTTIVIARVEEGPRQGEYLFTPETVDNLKRFYKLTKHLPYREEVTVSEGFFDFYIGTPGKLLPPKWADWLPNWSRQRLLAMTVWQWIGLPLLFLFFYMLTIRAYRWLVTRASLRSPLSRVRRQILFYVLVAAALLIIRFFTDHYLNISGTVLVAMIIVLGPIWWLLVSATVLSISRSIAESIISSPKIDPDGLQASYLRAVFSVTGFFLASAVFVYGLSRLGVSLLPLLTGVGIGGLAIALAARPTIENVIASFMIFADAPYRVGERLKVLEQTGDVESIGLRSTRIRLLTGPLMVIPNEKMASIEIENIGRRPYIRRTFDIAITYDTPPDRIRRAVQIVQEILTVPDKEADAPGQQPHPAEAVNQPDFPPRIYFSEFNSDSLNIEINYWFHPPELWASKEFADWINTQIKERFNAEGIDFAFPTQTLHLAGDNKRPLTIGTVVGHAAWPQAPTIERPE